MTAPVAVRVARGVAFLDEHAPDAVVLLDPDRLDVAAEKVCPLGQTFGSYRKAWELFSTGPDWGEDHGFEGVSGCGRRYWDDVLALNERWRSVVRARREMSSARSAGGVGTPGPAGRADANLVGAAS